jgi:hypothetical protein
VDHANETPAFISEADVIRRLGQGNLVDLEPYSGPEQIEPFLRDLIASRIDLHAIGDNTLEPTPDAYPFTADSWDAFVNELVAGAVSATPSKIIEGVSECAWEAHLRDELTISVDAVQEVMPRVTQAV